MIGAKTNNVELFHSGDLGDTVYAVPALRRLSYPAHLQLYPAPGVTRALMDQNNANMLLPLLNVQNGVSGSWVPSHAPDGLRLDMAVRRFYRQGYNLCDIHNNYVGHDHWHSEHPWFCVDKPDYRYRIVVARSARYRNPTYPWREFYRNFKDRACFVGVKWEHEDFEREVGKIPHVPTESLLDVARLMAGADLVLANQSCPRAVAEGLKTPIIVEQGNPANTHFGRRCAWYNKEQGVASFPRSWSDQELERIWCENAAMKAVDHSHHSFETLQEIARLTRHCRDVEGRVAYWGSDQGGISHMLCAATHRQYAHAADLYPSPNGNVDDLYRILRVFHESESYDGKGTPTPTAMHVFDVGCEEYLKDADVVLPSLSRMAPRGIVVMVGLPFELIRPYAELLGEPLQIPGAVPTPKLYAFRVNE